ncbi:nuclear transport factor 2 family protein [Bradyrhizobium sp. JYMT SZCCT0428]|uniref:nuclear transport factor 2 family protein n=1 Tax=Bradyrhizobium sp. JYMT SZCCT0428 TaxID=2807673 RepID=UPI001BA94271|nr:nuclear transport factor 2 family protein [Bradyrhizobium sp. JYMT SZCCT0428]MBR1157409.1 nuclear transport factor 2 family protein [Bradyrhizobium sp. JYMT SZCCT0428]
MSITRDEFDPLGIVVDWLDTCRLGDLSALVDMYDERAALECDCDGVTLIGRQSIAAYWAPKLALALATAFSMGEISLTAHGVCLDYRNYEGDPVRLLFCFTPSGKILHTECGPLGQRRCAA